MALFCWPSGMQRNFAKLSGSSAVFPMFVRSPRVERMIQTRPEADRRASVLAERTMRSLLSLRFALKVPPVSLLTRLDAPRTKHRSQTPLTNYWRGLHQRLWNRGSQMSSRSVMVASWSEVVSSLSGAGVSVKPCPVTGGDEPLSVR